MDMRAVKRKIVVRIEAAKARDFRVQHEAFCLAHELYRRGYDVADPQLVGDSPEQRRKALAVVS
jgi:hypothetical protein